MVSFILLLGVLPGLIWLIFYLREDTDHEPKREILYAFLCGMAITIVVLGVQNIFNDSVAPLINVVTLSPAYLFILAAIEELFKFSAAFLLIRHSKYFDVPVDAMIYMVIVALGFATVENLGALQNEIRETSLVSSAVGTLTLRFIGATLLHTLASATVGYYWAKGLIYGRLILNLCLGLILATILHTGFNILVLSFHQQSFYAIILLVVAAFFILNDFETLKHLPLKNGFNRDNLGRVTNRSRSVEESDMI